MILDYTALKEAAAKESEKQQQAFMDNLQTITDGMQEKHADIYRLFSKALEEEIKRKRQEAERKVEEETAAAAEAARAKYELTESKEIKALKQLAKMLRANAEPDHNETARGNGNDT